MNTFRNCRLPGGPGHSAPIHAKASHFAGRPLTFAKFAILACFGLSSCTKINIPKDPLVETVAVVMFDNETNEMDAADIMQELVYLALKPGPYKVSDMHEVNDFLKSKGIVDGGQLNIASPKKLGADLKVQAIMFGSVEEFGYTNVGYYQAQKVALNLRLVDVATGNTLWENTGLGATRAFTLDSKQAQQRFGEGLAAQLVDKLFKTPLEAEAKQAAQNALYTLPGFKFCGFTRDGKDVIKDSIKQSIRRH